MYQWKQPAKRAARPRRGITLVYVVFMLAVLLGFCVLGIDIGLMQLWHTRCQGAADAAARAGAHVLFLEGGDQAEAHATAVNIAEVNLPGAGTVLAAGDVMFGRWDPQARSFTPDTNSPNAIRCVVRRSAANANPLPLIFAAIFGRNEAEVSAEAIAAIPTGGAPQFRFLIDDEMIDTDIPSIEQLARDLGKTPEAVISDINGDGFIDFPPGRRLWLPTGQVGDEALFDRTQWEAFFPFTPTSYYSVLDFMLWGTNLQNVYRTKELKDATWTSANAPHPDLIGKKVLDPVPGIEMMDSHAEIMALPDPDAILVSPVYKSDIGMIERSPSKYGSPWANLLGERRAGLLAFKILDARMRSGSYLPEIYIEVVDPANLDIIAIANGTGGGGEIPEDARPSLVR